MLKTFRQWVGWNWIGALVCLVLGGVLLGSGYWLGQRSSRQDSKSAQAVSVPHPPLNPGNVIHPIPPTPGANIPANVTPEMKEFMQNRALLAEKMQQWRSQNAKGAADPKAFAQFQQQNADLLKRQSQLAQIISQQQDKNPLPAPPPLQIPPNATPQLTAFLTTRDQLMRDQVAFMNQHRNDDPAARPAAMQQWRQQNAARFQQLQQEAQAMAQNTPSTPPATTTK